MNRRSLCSLQPDCAQQQSAPGSWHTGRCGSQAVYDRSKSFVYKRKVLDIDAQPAADEAAASSKSRTFSAPARVNLVGEHSDCTGGFVLPMAIPLQTAATVTPAANGRCSFTSDMFDAVRSVAPEDLSAKTGEWSDYPVGVLREMQKLGIDPAPFALHLSGNVPLGSGLSSSASVEVATALALLAYSNTFLPVEQIATLCQRAENLYIGSPCGIMDQFVSAAAMAGHALLLNTRDLSYELVPINTGGLQHTVVVIANSGVKHSIAAGDYGLRRRELEAGQSVIRQHFPELRDLGDAAPQHLERCKEHMAAESFRRCPHVISENARVREAREAMFAGDPVGLGSAMTAAHASERDDFECSVEEIDFLVERAITLEGCYGARLTGGGFGGCTVNLVAAAQAETFSRALRVSYHERFGVDAETYTCDAVDGAFARAASSFQRQTTEAA